MDRYSFDVELSHLLLHAGLPAHRTGIVPMDSRFLYQLRYPGAVSQMKRLGEHERKTLFRSRPSGPGDRSAACESVITP